MTKDRIGPRMKAVYNHVRSNPGCTRAEVAAALKMPRSSCDAAIARVIRFRLIKVGLRGSTQTLYPVKEPFNG